MQEVEGSTPTGGTCPSDFTDPIDQDIRTQSALSWKIVVSEWRSVIAVRLTKPAKLYMCTQNTTNTRMDPRCRVCAAMVPSAEPLGECRYENWNTHTHTHKYVPNIMALTYIETEKYHKISEAYHKVNEANM